MEVYFVKPNIFHYATSELSQDAVLCWLAAWGDPRSRERDAHLHRLGKSFLSAIFKKRGRELPEIVQVVKSDRQHRNIDILITINDSIAVCIEDKVGSTEHSNQLQRYLEILREENFSDENVIPVYIQTGEQGSYKGVKSAGYEIMRRGELISLLQSYKDQGGTNSIVQDYFDHLHEIELQVNAFQTKPPSGWSDFAWQGFYSDIQDQLGDGEWSYVANQSGGFIGYWWSFRKSIDSEVYLQLEKDRLCFRISVDDAPKRGHLRDKWSARILAFAKDANLSVIRPQRLGFGQTMTVAVLDKDYRQLNSCGLLDRQETIKVLLSAAAVLDRALSQDPA